MDLQVLRFLRTRGHTPARDRAVGSFSKLGEHGGIWVAIAALGALLDRGCRPEYVRAGQTVALAYAANQLMKLAIRRRRPQLEDLPPLTATMSAISYPSAHAATSVAGAVSLSGLLPRAPLAALAAALAGSRLYLGVHYPSDSLAGAALGASVAQLRR